MSFLDDLLAQLADTPAADERDTIIRQALVDAGADLDTSGLTADILARFDTAQAEGTPDDAAVEALEALASVAVAITEHAAAQDQRSHRADQAADRIRSLVSPDIEPEPEPAELATGESPGSVDLDSAKPATEPTPAVPDQPVSATPLESVAASARPPAPVRVPLGLHSSAPPDHNGSPGRDTYTLVAASDVTGWATGEKLGSLTNFGRAWEARMAPLVSSGSRERQRVGVARLRRESPQEFTIRDARDAAEGEQKITAACDETRLPGGSLVAAGGWCAPSETLYDLCPIRITQEGLLSLPTVTAMRGGVRYPADFDWAALWGSAGFHLTEAESIAGQEKRCVEVPCPEDFIECRLDVDGVCIRTPILTERGWPERVAQFTEGVLAVHQHELNAWKIARMEALSTPVTMPPPGAPDPQAAVADPHGPGAVESVLSMIELQVQYQRYRDRLSQNATLEMVAPYWLRGILKSDLRKKVGVDNRWSITDTQLDTYLRAAGVNPQWVYDWQDAYTDRDEGGFGGPMVPTVWPSQVKILLYRAGVFFQLQADVISLDGVYDHDSLKQNMYTSLFTEEGVQVCRRCGCSYVLTIPLCANGLSGAGQATTCAPAAV